jgi:hypothetical protein
MLTAEGAVWVAQILVHDHSDSPSAPLGPFRTLVGAGADARARVSPRN